MWYCGDIEIDGLVFYYTAKVFEEGSKYGINNGRVSKLEIIFESYGKREWQAQYDREWVIKPTTIYAEKAVEYLLEKFN